MSVSDDLRRLAEAHQPWVLPNGTMCRSCGISASDDHYLISHHEWPCDVRVLLDRAASASDEGSLDAATLDEAMTNLGIHVDLRRKRERPVRERGCESCRKGVAAIVAEYARLRATPSPSEPETGK